MAAAALLAEVATAVVAVAVLVVCPQELPGVLSADAGTPWNVRRILPLGIPQGPIQESSLHLVA